MDHKTGDAPFFPLVVDYEEKFYAAGQILGSRFMRREGKPSDEAVLSARIVDRTIRPLFDHRIRNSVQVVLTVLSIDEDDPDVLAVLATSLALATSDIPWGGPVSAVRIGQMEGSDDLVVNPTYHDRTGGKLTFDSLVCGKDNLINMIEIGSREISNETAVASLTKASQVIGELQAFQEKIIAEIGKEKRTLKLPEPNETLIALFEKEIAPKLKDAVMSGPGKQKTGELKEEWFSLIIESDEEISKSVADDYFANQVDELLHREAIENDRRADGRKLNEVRELYAQAGGVSPMIHGTGIFYRGETHVLSALTLGGPGDAQLIDEIEQQDTKKHFMHHYNFPPFSVGETGRIGGFNRRQIGHGALAEKAIIPVLPSQNDFPYTIRIVSEALSSNGSTSMASVCGSTLALMDAGVPITRPVAGIAMGAMSDGTTTKILTDIQGPEDHHGDMDFKVAGTREGITAVQMDVKVKGFPIAVLEEAFQDAEKARLHILDVIEAEIMTPRAELNPNAPAIITLTIKPEQIGGVIGSGGKTINAIKDETGVEIEIEDSGQIYITGNKEGAEQAQAKIKALTKEYKPGEKTTGVVVKIVDFGAFVKLDEFNEGLVHISEIAPFRIEKVEDILKVGDEIPVSVKEINDRGQLRLSLKDADPNYAKKKES